MWRRLSLRHNLTLRNVIDAADFTDLRGESHDFHECVLRASYRRLLGSRTPARLMNVDPLLVEVQTASICSLGDSDMLRCDGVIFSDNCGFSRDFYAGKWRHVVDDKMSGVVDSIAQPPVWSYMRNNSYSAEVKDGVIGVRSLQHTTTFTDVYIFQLENISTLTGLKPRSLFPNMHGRFEIDINRGDVLVATWERRVTVFRQLIAQFWLQVKLNQRPRILDGILFEIGGVPRDKTRTISPAVGNKLAMDKAFTGSPERNRDTRRAAESCYVATFAFNIVRKIWRARMLLKTSKEYHTHRKSERQERLRLLVEFSTPPTFQVNASAAVDDAKNEGRPT
ncbi:hypothetical protein F5887DRAFT_1158519 [Amanita rubescens]|nr:hypothetical protein F5887DRAFT_1158519 [Amanita rubescens]